MVSERRMNGWRRWREAAFAACTVWLVLQNLALILLVTWGRPASALAAGTAIARTAITVGGQLFVLLLAAALGLALAAWLVHAPVGTHPGTVGVGPEERDVGEGRGGRDAR